MRRAGWGARRRGFVRGGRKTGNRVGWVSVNALRYSLLAWVLLVSGCATHADRLHAIRNAYQGGQIQVAAGRIDDELRHAGKEGDVLKLDRAMVELASGRPADAERTLREVRDRFDHLEQADLVEEAISMATDDTRRAYAGEDYEKVLIRAFLALSNLMHDGGDARAYALQMADKQKKIIEAGGADPGENPKLAYKLVALGPYLDGAIQEESRLNCDDLSRCRTMVCSWQPDFPYGPLDLERSRTSVPCAPGNGVVYVFALVGRGPYKEEVSEIPTQVALLIADRILTATNKYSLPPTIAPVKVPRVMRSARRMKDVLVSVEGRPCGSTATITDVSELAVQQYEAIYPQVIARAVVRRVVKKGAIYGAKQAMGVDPHGVANLALDVGGIVWEATEAADTRCWGLLPDQIQVFRLELPAGEHRLDLQPADMFGATGEAASRTIRVADGRNTYVLATFPDTHLVGEILASQP